MTGLEKIVSTIDEQSCNLEKSILSKAQADADRIINQAKVDAQKAYDEVIGKADVRCKQITQTAKSAAVTDRNKAVLSAKVDMIYEVLNAAADKIRTLPDREYFELLEHLAIKNVQSADGEILFNKKDTERLPADFISKVNEKSGKGTLTAGKGTVDTDGGFILKYGNIEINCSLSSLIKSKLDVLKDSAAEILFN